MNFNNLHRHIIGKFKVGDELVITTDFSWSKEFQKYTGVCVRVIATPNYCLVVDLPGYGACNLPSSYFDYATPLHKLL